MDLPKGEPARREIGLQPRDGVEREVTDETHLRQRGGGDWGPTTEGLVTPLPEGRAATTSGFRQTGTGAPRPRRVQPQSHGVVGTTSLRCRYEEGPGRTHGVIHGPGYVRAPTGPVGCRRHEDPLHLLVGSLFRPTRLHTRLGDYPTPGGKPSSPQTSGTPIVPPEGPSPPSPEPYSKFPTYYKSYRSGNTVDVSCAQVRDPG